MFLQSLVRVSIVILLLVVLFHFGDNVVAQSAPKVRETPKSRGVNVIVWTDRQTYSLRDVVKLHAALQNNGEETKYVDRRMSWTGLSGGLKLGIRNERGEDMPARVLSDAILPPPEEGDTSVLIRLEPGFLYGTYVNLKAKDFFPKPGRYSLQVAYGSWIHKELVAPQLRNLPALWADSPIIFSKSIQIDITR